MSQTLPLMNGEYFLIFLRSQFLNLDNARNLVESESLKTFLTNKRIISNNRIKKRNKSYIEIDIFILANGALNDDSTIQWPVKIFQTCIDRPRMDRMQFYGGRSRWIVA